MRISDPTPTVFVVDDDPSVLLAVARLLRSAGLSIATFASPQEFLAQYKPHACGCLVLDFAMPALNGLELQDALAAQGSRLPIVFLTGRGDIPTSVAAMKRGALDFLTKPVDDEDLLKSVTSAIEKDRLNRQARGERAEIEARLGTLTPREREVLGHLIAGRLNKQIAANLGIVEKTIKVHRARVLEKMRVRSLAELARLAERAGIGPTALT